MFWSVWQDANDWNLGCLCPRARASGGPNTPELIIIQISRTPPPPHGAHNIFGNEATVPCPVLHLLAARRTTPVEPATKMVSRRHAVG